MDHILVIKLTRTDERCKKPITLTYMVPDKEGRNSVVPFGFETWIIQDFS